MATATLTSKGQMVVPKPIRDSLHLQPGDRLDFTLQENGDILLRPAQVDLRQLKGLLQKPGRAVVSLEEMTRVIRKRGGGGR